MLKKNLLLTAFPLLLTFGTMLVSGASYRLVPVLNKVNIKSNPKVIMVRVTLRRQTATQNFSMNVDVTVPDDVQKGAFNVGYFVRIRNSNQWMYNKTFDMCAYLQRPSLDRFGSFVYEALRRHGPMPRCPVKARRYSYQNLTLDSVRMPAFLPETNFGFVLNGYHGPKQELCFESIWYGRLMKVPV